MQNPFVPLDPLDVAGRYQALRQLVSDLHGVDIQPHAQARQNRRDTLLALGVAAQSEVFEAVDLLSDLAATEAFDTVLASKGMIRGKAHAYAFEIQDMDTIDARYGAISLMRTKRLDTYFTVPRRAAGAQVPMTVLSRHSKRSKTLEPEFMHGHQTLLSWLVKFLVPNDLGRSLLFANYIDDPQVADFHAAASALYGPPAHIAPDCLLYIADNVMITVRGGAEPWMDLWVLDQTVGWARNEALLAPMQLNEKSLQQWATDSKTP